MVDKPEILSTEPLPPPENRRHYPGLDGLRGLAVVMVFFQHYISVRPSLRWSWTGVRIFFVLSGFLITGILYDTREARRRWSVFCARRALRIFPLYYGALLFGVLSYPIFHWILHPSYLLWPLYLQNFARFIWPADVPSEVVDHLWSLRYRREHLVIYYGHFWSLGVEEQFYLIWPLLVFWIKRRSTLMKICLAVIIATPLARLACSLLLPTVQLNLGFEERFTFLQCDGLLMGGFFALWMRGPCPDLTLIGKRLLWAVAGIVVAAEALCPILYHRSLSPAIGDPIFASLGFTCVNVAATGLVLLAIDPKTVLSRVLQRRPLPWLGLISYSFYVLHDMPHWFYNRLAVNLPHGPLAAALIGFVCTIALASLSYYGFERRFLALKRGYTISEKPTLLQSEQVAVERLS